MCAKYKNGLNVLLVAHRFYVDSPAGTETLVEDMASELKKRGNNVYILAVKPDNLDTMIDITVRDDGIVCVSIPCFKQDNIIDKWGLMEITQMKRVAEAMARLSINFHIVHLFHFARIGMLFYMLPCFSTSKLFITFVDYTLICPDYQLFARKDGQICTNYNNANDCVKCLDTQINHESIEVWKNINIKFVNNYVQKVYCQTKLQREYIILSGVKNNIMSSAIAAYQIPIEWRNFITKNSEVYSVGYFGRISQEKGVHIILDAYTKYLSEDTKMLICGNYDGDKNYNEHIASIVGRYKNITYMPPVPRNELYKLMLSVKCVLVPSQWNENNSVLMSYACALQKPVICSLVPSIEEMNCDNLFFVTNYCDPQAWAKKIRYVQNISSEFRVDVNESISRYRRKFQILVDEIERDYRQSLTIK